MGLLSAQQILAASDCPCEDVPVPEWGGVVRIKTLSGAEWDAFKQSCYDIEGSTVKSHRENLTARMVAAAAVDESGHPLFTPEQVEALGRKSIAALTRLCEAAERLAGVRPGDAEEMAKN